MRDTATTYDEEMKRKVVMTITENKTDADIKVKFDFLPNIGGVVTHPGLKQAVMALMALVNNKFETAGKEVEE